MNIRLMREVSVEIVNISELELTIPPHLKAISTM
jgi:hypothetical protein